MTTRLKITQANQLGWDDLGRTVRLVGADGTSYEGALTYLSFSKFPGGSDLPVVIAADPDGWFELTATHLVEVEW